MEKIKVLVVDDHHMFIRGIKSIIMDEESFDFVGEAHNGFEGYEMAKELQPHVILMDVNMPICDGIEALKMIRAAYPHIKVVMLTVNDRDENLFEALKSGAVGYLLKNIHPNELVTFIHMASRGESVISGPMATKIIQHFSQYEAKPETPIQDEKPKQIQEILTRREKEILLQVIKGLTNREIAEVLIISENTVKNHLRNIMEKLHKNNRVQAATYALTEGLLNNE